MVTHWFFLLDALPAHMLVRGFPRRSLLDVYPGISLLRTEQGLIMELLFHRGLTWILLVNGEHGLNMEISHVALS